MDKDILYEILQSESESLTAAEIESIMNEELDKSPDEMDTDLIELCLDALTKANEEELKSKKHRVRLSRVLIAAVIFIMVLVFAIPVCAKVFYFDVPEGVVRIYNDYFYIDLSGDEDKGNTEDKKNKEDKENISDINQRIQADGIENPILPSFIYSDEVKIYDYKFNKNDIFDDLFFSFTYNELSGGISILRSNEIDNLFDNNTVSQNFDYIKYFEKDNCRGIILVNKYGSSIQYIDGNISYNIILDCDDYETALEIAESL